jgi:hypothetical protein
MRYHYIEDFVGNLMEWVDGVYSANAGSSYTDYVTSKPSNYNDATTNHNLLAYRNSSNGCIAGLGWDPANPFLCVPSAYVTDTSYSTCFCDYVYRASSRPCIYTGAAYNGSAYNGRTYWYSASTTNSATSIGARLLYSGVLE